MTLALLGALGSTALLFALTAWRGRRGKLERDTGRDLVATIGLCLGTYAVAFIRGDISDTTTTGTLRALTLLNLGIVLVSGADPGGFFASAKDSDEVDALSREQRVLYDLREKKAVQKRLLLIAVILAGVSLYSGTGATFLD